MSTRSFDEENPEQPPEVAGEGTEPLPGKLIYCDAALQSSALDSINQMRKNRHFCDVILHVGNAEIHAHRAILASASPYLFELFSSDQEQKRIGNIINYKLNGGFDKQALEILVEYAYTTKLEVSFPQVKAVYLAAQHLKMDRVVRQCAKYLIRNLSVKNCIETRSLPGITRNKELIQEVDKYIASEFMELSKSSSLLNLLCARIDVLNKSREEMLQINHNSVCRLVLEWIKQEMTDESLRFEMLSERTFMLYLAIDNSLQDCSGLPPGDISDTEIVQNYKKMSSKTVKSNSKSKKKLSSQPSKPRVLLYSRDIDAEIEAECEPDWNLIATAQVAEHTTLALVALAGRLVTLSVQLRLNMPSPSPVSTPEASRCASEEKPDLYCTIKCMSAARCAVGCGNFQNTLLVVGGYDRVECLRSVEHYIPEINKWGSLPPMREARGRFQIAILDDKVYAIGGSNGTADLDTAEMYDASTGRWSKLPRLPLARSSLGVCELGGLIYCVGGWIGQVGSKQCDIFNPSTSTWSTIAPLNTGRYQAGVTAYGGLLYAVGGFESWCCLSSVEIYNPAENEWKFSKPIITARRGCGVAVFNNKLYVVGGSDGSHSLKSTEIFDEETGNWVVGPSMTTSRANVEVAVVGDRLYAVGGFSGKTFLNTIEYLDHNSNQWTTFVPKTAGDLSSRRRSRSRKNSARKSLSEDSTCKPLNKRDSVEKQLSESAISPPINGTSS